MKIFIWALALILASVAPIYAHASCTANITFTQPQDCADVDHWKLEYDGVPAPDITIPCSDPIVVVVPVVGVGSKTFQMKAVAKVCLGGTNDDVICADDTDCTGGGTCTGTLESQWSNAIAATIPIDSPTLNSVVFLP